MNAIHPIEAESYRRLGDRVDLSAWSSGPRAVVARVIHASADLDFATTMVVDEAAVDAGVAALRAGAAVIADVEMVRAGMPSLGACCHLGDVADGGELTRAAAGLRLAAHRHPAGAVVVVGCAPTALVEAVQLIESGRFSPALLIGLPVGFVGAAESKDALAANASGLEYLVVRGRRGGSAIAAAALNALASEEE